MTIIPLLAVIVCSPFLLVMIGCGIAAICPSER